MELRKKMTGNLRSIGFEQWQSEGCSQRDPSVFPGHRQLVVEAASGERQGASQLRIACWFAGFVDDESQPVCRHVLPAFERTGSEVDHITGQSDLLS